MQEVPAELDFPHDDKAAGRVDAFVKAAGRRDYEAMFELFPARTRQYGPTPEAFARNAGQHPGVILGAMARTQGATSG